MLSEFDRVVRHWLSVMPEGEWASSRLVYASVAGRYQTHIEATGLDGVLRRLATPRAAVDALEEQRGPSGRAAWLGIELELEPGQEPVVTERWDDEVWFGAHPGAPFARPIGAGSGPTRDEWVQELTAHPRSLDRIPIWWRTWVGESVARRADELQLSARTKEAAEASVPAEIDEPSASGAAPQSLRRKSPFADPDWPFDSSAHQRTTRSSHAGEPEAVVPAVTMGMDAPQARVVVPVASGDPEQSGPAGPAAPVTPPSAPPLQAQVPGAQTPAAQTPGAQAPAAQTPGGPLLVQPNPVGGPPPMPDAVPQAGRPGPDALKRELEGIEARVRGLLPAGGATSAHLLHIRVGARRASLLSAVQHAERRGLPLDGDLENRLDRVMALRGERPTCIEIVLGPAGAHLNEYETNRVWIGMHAGAPWLPGAVSDPSDADWAAEAIRRPRDLPLWWRWLVSGPPPGIRPEAIGPLDAFVRGLPRVDGPVVAAVENLDWRQLVLELDAAGVARVIGLGPNDQDALLGRFGPGPQDGAIAGVGAEIARGVLEAESAAPVAVHAARMQAWGAVSGHVSAATRASIGVSVPLERARREHPAAAALDRELVGLLAGIAAMQLRSRLQRA